MTAEEWKDFEMAVAEAKEYIRLDVMMNDGGVSKGSRGVLAAFKELKEEREDREWLENRRAAVAYSKGERVIRWVEGKAYVNSLGPTLHAAILAARKEK